MATSPASKVLAAIVLALIAPPLHATEPPKVCGTAYSNLESDFTEAAVRLAPFLCKHPNQFQVEARKLVDQTNAKINRFNLAHPAGSCDPDVPAPVPLKNAAHVMTILQDDIGAIPLDRYCNNLLDGNQLCGNDRVDRGEICDGADLSGQTCESVGQGAGTLACAADCKSFVLEPCDGPAFCGNGRVDQGEGEVCDGPGNTVTCDFDCTTPVCGDGLTNTEAGEECDPGSGIPCTAECQVPQCGNTIFEPEAGEQCDDGNLTDTDGCTGSCRLATCGDAILRLDSEQCDDGNTLNSDACTNICLNARCGDGIVYTAVEQCDDGNNNFTDGCTAHCQAAFCGDGFVRLSGVGVEQCDDRNNLNGDGCSATCEIEAP